MNLTNILQIVQIGASGATLVGLLLTVYQIGLVNKQAKTTFEDGLTTHYRGIMEDIPIEIWWGAGLDSLDYELQRRCQDAIFRYIDLSNGQAFLHNKGRVTDGVWDEWSEGIRSNMKLPAFEQVWKQTKEHCPDSFIELRKLLSDAPTSSPKQQS